jgi:hypothetical protein
VGQASRLPSLASGLGASWRRHRDGELHRRKLVILVKRGRKGTRPIILIPLKNPRHFTGTNTMF